MDQKNKPEISLILPVFNEVENLRTLYQAIKEVMESLHRSYEIIFSDDGSRDGSVDVLRELAQNDQHIMLLLLKRNFGQTAALNAGIDHANGDILVMMDSDGQNDPADIPKLLAKLDEGYDIVSGWRKDRHDPWLTKVVPSRIANWIISRVTGVRLHDHGCTLKAYRKEILDQIELYGEMHRFISIYGYWQGARVGEVEVSHYPRTKGKSKYSMAKTFKVLLDLPLLILLGSYITRPMHFFGAVGLLFNFGAFICVFEVAYEKYIEGDQASDNPFLLLAVFFALAGIQILMIGLLAELITRVYHEGQQKKTYVIKEKFPIL